jgi:hypothetical protein
MTGPLLAAAIHLAFCLFGLFDTKDPGFGNLNQHGAISPRSGARQPAAFGSVVAKFLSVGIFVFGIDFHFEFRIAIDSSTPHRKIGLLDESSGSNFRA